MYLSLLAFVIATLFEAIVKGFALSVMWSWFVVHSFGLRPLSLPESIGLMLVASIMTSQYVDNDQANNKSFTEVILLQGIVHPIVVAAVALAVGFIAKAFL